MNILAQVTPLLLVSATMLLRLFPLDEHLQPQIPSTPDWGKSCLLTTSIWALSWYLKINATKADLLVFPPQIPPTLTWWQCTTLRQKGLKAAKSKTPLSLPHPNLIQQI